MGVDGAGEVGVGWRGGGGWVEMRSRWVKVEVELIALCSLSGKLDLKASKTNKDKFERKQTDVFSIDADVGELKKIR